jgi:hypothetical protein
MWNLSLTLHEILGLYTPLIVGCMAQLVFLALPVDLKNWDDDFLNVMTYASVQMLVAGLIFIAIPIWMEVFHLETKAGAILILSSGFLAIFRSLRFIPLENTHPIALPREKPSTVQFSEFDTPIRMRLLAEASTLDPAGKARYEQIKERLVRRRPEKYESGPASLKHG